MKLAPMATRGRRRVLVVRSRGVLEDDTAVGIPMVFARRTARSVPEVTCLTTTTPIEGVFGRWWFLVRFRHDAILVLASEIHFGRL